MKQKYLAKALALLKKILQKSRYQKSAKGVISFWAILSYLISNTSKSVLRAWVHFISVVTISGLCTLWPHIIYTMATIEVGYEFTLSLLSRGNKSYLYHSREWQCNSHLPLSYATLQHSQIITCSP